MTGLLERARRHIFSTGVEDSATELCKANSQYGIAKMHILQSNMGLEPNATFISSPDETVTRNAVRWNQGLGYGGKICWGNGKEKLIVLDTKPNCCGMLVGGINHIPKPEEIIENVYSLGNKDHYIDDLKVKWDFNKGNHFIDIFEVKDASIKLPKYVVILHAGAPEVKGDNESKYGFGLYYNSSKRLNEMQNEIKTRYGSIRYIEGSDAQEYLKFYNFAEDFAKKRREIAFNEIFNGKVISNHCHQGLTGYNEIKLGCHDVKDFKSLYPFSIKADVPSYLFKAKKNLTKKHIEDLGFAERANELGVYKRLNKANLFPHGGGYTFEDSLYVSNIFHVKGQRYFELDLKDGIGKKIIRDPKDIQFSYRSREVFLKTLEIGLGEPQAKLMPLYVVKI